MTIRELCNKGKDILCDAGIEDYEFDAVQLIMSSLEMNYTEYFLSENKIADAAKENRYLRNIIRRAEGEPLQYILGKWDFYKYEFNVGPGVLIPRPETEELVDLCIKKIKEKKYKVIYDLCAGSGCIGLSVAKEFPEVKVYLFELYEDAAKYLKKNINKLELNNAEYINKDIIKGFCENLPEPDMIISNPPYINTNEISSLQSEVQKEPVTALDGGSDGLVFYRAIKTGWLPFLQDGGSIAVECGEGQTESICDLFNEIVTCQTIKDMYGVDRFVFGSKN